MTRMSDDNRDPLGDVLANAITAADAAAQTASGIWSRMTPKQRKKWCERRATYSPRHDILLDMYLAAAACAIGLERVAKEGNDPLPF